MPSLLRRLSLRRPRSKKNSNGKVENKKDDCLCNNEENMESNEICKRPSTKRERQQLKKEILKPGIFFFIREFSILGILIYSPFCKGLF